MTSAAVAHPELIWRPRHAGPGIAHFHLRAAALTTDLDIDVGHIDAILRRGAERAAAIAVPVLDEVKDITGLLRP